MSAYWPRIAVLLLADYKNSYEPYLILLAVLDGLDDFFPVKA